RRRALIKGFDHIEKARKNAELRYKLEHSRYYGYNIRIVDDLYSCVKDTDGIIATVEYQKLNNEDWERIATLVKEKVVFDGRNILNKEMLKELNFTYVGIGRNSFP
ncbi:MAG: hypothetical protein DRO65_00950, partial [Candidatus Altiarchaeales archaeon]